jgi:hypothetical protein
MEVSDAILKESAASEKPIRSTAFETSTTLAAAETQAEIQAAVEPAWSDRRAQPDHVSALFEVSYRTTTRVQA